MATHKVPIIDIHALVTNSDDILQIGIELRNACTNHGFFYIKNHGISEQLQHKLEHLTHRFFELDEQAKLQISMSKGGRAWRGYFPIGNELTSGKPDLKEGIYFGAELHKDHVKVKTKTPMHGANLFPNTLPEFRRVVLQYMDELIELGHHLMKALAISLGLPKLFFREKYTHDPLTLFRIFHYPPPQIPSFGNAEWGVGEHTDYGVLTILKQDNIGGLQVKSKSGWIVAPYIPGTFICNIGDMLDRMTGGYYRSTPHRVINKSGKSRYSWPFFFDPNWDVVVEPLPIEKNSNKRWDNTDIHEFKDTYGNYVLSKVSKVFPELKQNV